LQVRVGKSSAIAKTVVVERRRVRGVGFGLMHVVFFHEIAHRLSLEDFIVPEEVILVAIRIIVSSLLLRLYRLLTITTKSFFLIRTRRQRNVLPRAQRGVQIMRMLFHLDLLILLLLVVIIGVLFEDTVEV